MAKRQMASQRGFKRQASGSGSALRLISAGVMALLTVHALAGVNEPPVAAATSGPPVAPLVRKLLDAPYLTDVERIKLRVRHGLATAEDVQFPAIRARVALQRGVYDDDALVGVKSVAADPLDRAEAALMRGQLDDAWGMLQQADAEPVRALRLRAQVLEQLGFYPQAAEMGRTALKRLKEPGVRGQPAELVESVRALAVALRHAVRGGEAVADAAQSDYAALINLLADARRQDPLSWEARLAEAELLADKDNYAEAFKALEEASKLNPSAAAIWSLYGQLTVNAFDLSRAESVARQMDENTVMPGEAVEVKEGQERWEALKGRSLEAGVVRARAMLRQDAPDLAGEAIKPLVDRYTASRLLGQAEAGVMALGYDWAALDALLAKFDDRSTSQAAKAGLPPVPAKPAEAFYAAGKALADARQYDQAARCLRIAAERSPAWVQPVAELGLLEVQSGRDSEALTALNTAASLDPFNVRVANSLKLLRQIAGFSRVEGDHFIIRASAGLDALLAVEMLPALEASARTVTGDGLGGLRHTPARKTVIDLMPTHAMFAVRIAGMPRIHTIAASTGPVIAMEAPREGAGHSGTYDWDRVLRHEYTHTVGLSRTGNRIPHWFTEAQAVYLEQAPRDYRTVELLTKVMLGDDLFDFTEINIAFTRPRKPTDRQQAYAQGHWMIEYMIATFGTEAPLKLMDLYAKGVREEQAFSQVLGVSREQFMTSFHAWAGGQMVAWGMDIPEGTPTVERLLNEERGRLAVEQGKKPYEVDEVEPTLELVDGWLKRYPNHPDVLELAIGLRLRASNGEPTPEMGELLNSYATARPVDPMPRRHLAKLSLLKGDWAAAITHLEYLDAREEKTSTYAVELANAYARAGDLEKAWAKALRATRMGPYQAVTRETAATIALRRKDYDGARLQLEFLAMLEPEVPLHQQRLDALIKLKNQQN